MKIELDMYQTPVSYTHLVSTGEHPLSSAAASKAPASTAASHFFFKITTPLPAAAVRQSFYPKLYACLLYTSNESNEQADAHADGALQGHGAGIEDALPDIGEGQHDEDDALHKDGHQGQLPAVAPVSYTHLTSEPDGHDLPHLYRCHDRGGHHPQCG